jgi:hypothetical protein
VLNAYLNNNGIETCPALEWLKYSFRLLRWNTKLSRSSGAVHTYCWILLNINGNWNSASLLQVIRDENYRMNSQSNIVQKIYTKLSRLHKVQSETQVCRNERFWTVLSSLTASFLKLVLIFISLYLQVDHMYVQNTRNSHIGLFIVNKLSKCNFKLSCILGLFDLSQYPSFVWGERTRRLQHRNHIWSHLLF